MKAAMKWAAWYELRVPDEISRLRALRQAILKWTDLAQREFAARWEGQEGVADWRADWGYDPQADDAFTLQQTERVLFASLAVTISSTVESFVADICTSLRLKLRDRADYGCKATALEEKLGVKFLSLPGHKAQRKARLLSNCFKHFGGKTDGEYVKAFDGPKDQEIEYEGEDWAGLLSGVETFLLAVAAKIPEVSVRIEDVQRLLRENRAAAKAEAGENE